MKRNKNNDHIILTSKCKRCNGVGFIYEKKYAEEIDSDMPLEQRKITYGQKLLGIGKTCPVCKGKDIALIWEHSEMPYTEVDYPSFKWDSYKSEKAAGAAKEVCDKYFYNFDTMTNLGMGLYIYSDKRGSGKTLLSCCIGQSLIAKYKMKVFFISSVEYLAKVKEGYNRQAGSLDMTQKYFDCDVLIMDDIGSERNTETAREELFRLFDYRTSHGKICILSSNVSIKDYKTDTRITERLYDKCFQIHMPEEEIRSDRASQKKMELLSKLSVTGKG